MRGCIEDCYKVAAENDGYCLSETYKGKNFKYTWQCKDKYIWSARYSHIEEGGWCPHCAGVVKYTKEECQKSAKEKDGYFLSDEYTGVNKKHKWMCQKEHIWEMTYASVLQGRWCPTCSGFKRYTHNTFFFSHDTPEAFYWAGFIAADGCIGERGKSYKTLTIGLATKDIEHLQKFKKAIEFTGPINEEEHLSPPYLTLCYSCRITISISKSKVYKDLKRFGIGPRKSLTYTFPEWIKDHILVNHFIRGYFDGDGSVHSKSPSPSDILCGSKMKKLCLSFRGTEDFLNSCQEVLMKNCNIKIKHKVHDNSAKVGSLAYVGNRIVLRIANFIYLNSTENARLERKHSIIYNGFFNCLPENCQNKPVIGTNKKTEEKIQFVSIKSAAKYIGSTVNSLSRCLCGGRKSCRGFKWEYVNKKEMI